MTDCFEVVKNKLHVRYQPVNDLDEFAKECMSLLAQVQEDHGEVYIIMGENVDSINSSYVGVLMSCAMLSNQMGKTLHIICNKNVQRLINVLGGHKLLKFIEIKNANDS